MENCESQSLTHSCNFGSPFPGCGCDDARSIFGGAGAVCPVRSGSPALGETTGRGGVLEGVRARRRAASAVVPSNVTLSAASSSVDRILFRSFTIALSTPSVDGRQGR